MAMTRFFLGLDLWQSRDLTALAIWEWTEAEGARDPVTWEYRKVILQRVRHLERMPLGTTYPEVVARVTEVMRTLGRS